MPADQDLPDYDSLERELQALEIPGAAECHGVIAGVLSSPQPSNEAWVQSVFADANAAADSSEAERLLEGLRDYTDTRLAARESEFFLLLPDDDRTLAERATALADFCRGFLLGLVAGGVRELDALPAEAREVVEDFMKIAEAEADGRATEVEEHALAQISEYVRTGVQLVYEELRSAD